MRTQSSMRPRSSRIPAAVLATLACLMLLSACSTIPEVELVLDEHEYASWEVERMAEETDLSEADGIDVADAADVRKEVLVDLRRRGPEGETVADLLTLGFPERTEAVPVHAERALMDGVPTWIVVEAYGDDEGPLGHGRVWAFDAETGDVLLSASFR